MGEAWSKAGLKVSAKDRLCGRAKVEVPALSLLLRDSGLVISSLSETQFLYLVQQRLSLFYLPHRAMQWWEWPCNGTQHFIKEV